MKKYLSSIALAALITFAQPSLAQEADSGMNQRLELAARMHEIRPAREQIDAAVEQVSSALPAGEKEAFRLAIKNALDYQALERHSIESMAKVFTLEELQAMVDFYSKPEAGSITDKLGEYNKLIEPKVFEMLDQAILDVRTGKKP